MTLIVDEGMLREPNLLIPGRKPVGSVKIDWRHPSSGGLVAYIMPRSKDGLGKFPNYANHSIPGVAEGTAPTSNPFRTAIEGESIECHPSGGTFGVDYITVDGSVIGNSDDCTMISVTRPNTFTSPNEGNIYRGVGNDSLRSTITSTNFYFSYVDSSPLAGHDTNLTLPSIALGDYIPVAGRKDSNVVQGFALVNNSFLSSATAGGTGSGTMRDDGSGNKIRLNGGSNINNTGHINVIVSMVFRRALSDSEIESLLRDPYQFIVPA